MKAPKDDAKSLALSTTLTFWQLSATRYCVYYMSQTTEIYFNWPDIDSSLLVPFSYDSNSPSVIFVCGAQKEAAHDIAWKLNGTYTTIFEWVICRALIYLKQICFCTNNFGKKFRMFFIKFFSVNHKKVTGTKGSSYFDEHWSWEEGVFTLTS